MPAAAVIPAPIAYIKVVAVKKLVVGTLVRGPGPPSGVHVGSPSPSLGRARLAFTGRPRDAHPLL